MFYKSHQSFWHAKIKKIILYGLSESPVIVPLSVLIEAYINTFLLNKFTNQENVYYVL
jgi:hypothetical protein